MDDIKVTLYHAPISRVQISPTTLRKLWLWTCACPCELSALGVAEITDTTLTITDEIFLLKQKGSMAHTDLNMEAVDQLHRDRYRRQEPTENIRFWFHSHADFSAFFSPTDERTIEELGAFHPILIAGVFNRHGDTRWCLRQHGSSVTMKHDIKGPRITPEEVKEVEPLIDANVIREDRYLQDWWHRKRAQWRRDDDWEDRRWEKRHHDVV